MISMTSFTPVYITFAKTILQTQRDKVEAWAQDKSNPELRNACLMMLDAAKAGK